MKAAAANWNALRGYGGITPADQLGRNGASYTDDIRSTLRALQDLNRKGRISNEDFNKYRTEFVGAIDPQQVYDSFRNADVSHPKAQAAWDDYGERAFLNARKFYADAVNRGLMTAEQAQANLNKIQTGAPSDPIYDWRKKVKPIQDPAKRTKPTKPAANTQNLVFNYRPGKWVDTRTGQPITAPVSRKKKKVRRASAGGTPSVAPASAPVAAPAPTAPLPATPASTPVDLSSLNADTLTGVIPGVTRTAPVSAPLTVSPEGIINTKEPNINALTIQPDKPIAVSVPAPAQAPAPAAVPVKAPRRAARRQHTYEDALNNGWSADADNTYGKGWVYRDNGDGTRTYRSPSQIKKLDPKAARGGITVDAPRPAPAQKPKPQQPADAATPVAAPQ